MTTSLDYIRTRRDMPWIKRGMRVEVDGRMGVVTSGNHSGNINVRLDGEKHAGNCHPWWKTRYFDGDGNVIADYREDGDE